MTLSNADVTRLLLSLVLLLVVAHGLGRLCTRLRQPKVAGEILGGLLLGPTLFGLLLPSWQHAVFQSGTATPAALGVFYQLGLLLLMYCSGAELRTILARRERKATIGIALLANAAPFVAGLAFHRFYDSGRFLGRAQNPTAFLLVFALAMAVTSIPVIARIMADLGILGTRFARIVLSVAVLEDLLVYMVLNFALALVAPPHAETFSLPSLLSLRPASVLGNGYYLIVTLGFFALPALWGRGFVGRLVGWQGEEAQRHDEVVAVAEDAGRPPRRRPARRRRTRPANDPGLLLRPLHSGLLRGGRPAPGPGPPFRAAVLRVLPGFRLPDQDRERLRRSPHHRRGQGWRPQPRHRPQRPRGPWHRAGLGRLRRRHHRPGLLHDPGAAGPGHLGPCRLLAGSNAPPRRSPPHRNTVRAVQSRMKQVCAQLRSWSPRCRGSDRPSVAGLPSRPRPAAPWRSPCARRPSRGPGAFRCRAWRRSSRSTPRRAHWSRNRAAPGCPTAAPLGSGRSSRRWRERWPPARRSG